MKGGGQGGQGWPGVSLNTGADSRHCVHVREGLREGHAPQQISQTCTKLQGYIVSPFPGCKSEHLELRHPGGQALQTCPHLLRQTLLCPRCINNINKEQ